MAAARNSRLDYLSSDYWDRSIADRLVVIRDRQTSFAKQPQTQSRYFASDYQFLGYISYATGYPLEQVRDYLNRSIEAWFRVFELRGTEAPFPVTLVTLDPTKKASDPASIISKRPMHAADAKDHSVTNSKNGLNGVWLAIAAGRMDLAERLAAMLWDPPDVRWLAPNSVVCTPNQQQLAYAVQKLFAGEAAGVEPHLSQVRVKRWEEESLRFQAKAVRGLAEGDRVIFLSELHALVDWHTLKAREPKNKDEWNYYLCLAGLGLAGWAVWRGLVEPNQLPQENVYLPLELLPEPQR